MSQQLLIADIPVGLDGLYGSKNPAQLPPTALVKANNLTYIDGTLKKEGGATRYNATAVNGSILAGCDWWPTTLLQRSVIVTSAGKVLKDLGLGTYPVTLKSGLAIASPLGVFVTGGQESSALPRKLFLFTGSDQVQVLKADEAAMANISTPPADWSEGNFPIGGFVHLGRLWGFGNLNDPHRLYYSTQTNHQDFTSAGSGTFSIYPGCGERILQCISLRGFIAILKYPEGIYVLDTRDPVSTSWRPDRVSESVGICSTAGAVNAETGLMFMDASGNIQSFEQVTEGSFGIRNLGTVGQIKSFINSNLNLSELDKVKAIFYPKDREIHFCVPHGGSSINNRRLVADLNQEAMRFRYSDRDRAVSVWSRKDSGTLRLMTGDDAGVAWTLDQDARSKDGAGYRYEFETSPMDLAHIDPILSTRRKDGHFLELVYEPTGLSELHVDLLWDGKLEDTYTFQLTGQALGFILGQGVLGVSRLGPGGVLANAVKRVTGSGKRLALRGYNSASGQNVSISKFMLHYTLGDERLSV